MLGSSEKKNTEGIIDIWSSEGLLVAIHIPQVWIAMKNMSCD